MLRIGTVPYLVARPLGWGLAEHPQVELHVAPPAALATQLRRGELDLALASSVLSLPPDDLPFWIDGPVIAAPGAIRSVVLMLRPGLKSPKQIRSLGLDRDSRTGRALAEVVLNDRYGVEAHATEINSCDPLDPDLDAIQLIGDPALHARRRNPDWRVLDLGEEWARLTGLPFVFAGWIARQGFDPEEAAHILRPAAVQGLKARAQLVDEGIVEIGHDRHFLHRYLYDDLCYSLPATTVHDALSEFAQRLRLPVR